MRILMTFLAGRSDWQCGSLNAAEIAALQPTHFSNQDNTHPLSAGTSFRLLPTYNNSYGQHLNWPSRVVSVVSQPIAAFLPAGPARYVYRLTQFVGASIHLRTSLAVMPVWHRASAFNNEMSVSLTRATCRSTRMPRLVPPRGLKIRACLTRLELRWVERANT